MTVKELASLAKSSAGDLAFLSGETKNRILLDVADGLEKDASPVLVANKKDLEAAAESGLSEAMLERLTLTPERIIRMAADIRELAAQPDPIGEVVSGSIRPNGLIITERRVPIGVVAMIYESRPNVTVDAAALCIKSGNAAVLRGGKEALKSNVELLGIIKNALQKNGVSPDAVGLITDTSRDSASELMSLVGIVDVLIPRGGKGLIDAVVKNSKVPVIETGAGNCHIFADSSADLDMALNITVTARMGRPSVCNSAEKLLVHKDIAEALLNRLYEEIGERCELRGCERARAVLPEIKVATEEDWYTEYNDYILGVKVVDSVEEAVAHINKYNTKHSEAIITNDVRSAQYFTDRVDAAAVYLNASTRFTDGNVFGLSAEIGISTAKLHVRGPMGLTALTTTKYIVTGDGQTR